MCASGETVLLVDFDMRKSIIHRVFGLEKEPGLSNLLMGSNPIDKTIRTMADNLMGELGWDTVLATPWLDHLHIMTAGSSVTNPAELLTSPELNRFLGDVKPRYNYILCDCPPVLPVTDTVLIGSNPDTMVLVVYQAGRTARWALQRTKEQLVSAGIKVKGIILNHLAPEMEVSPTYYYHYYKYYPTEKKPRT